MLIKFICYKIKKEEEVKSEKLPDGRKLTEHLGMEEI